MQPIKPTKISESDPIINGRIDTMDGSTELISYVDPEDYLK